VDFRITLGDGTELEINLLPEDMVDVQTMLASINEQADLQLVEAGRPTTLFSAGLTDGANGIAFTQDTTDPSVTGAVRITQRNNSPAAEQLGLLTATYDPTTGTLLSEDRAKVRVDNIFTHLIDLRDALLSDDDFGIGIATDLLNTDLDRVAETRGLVGGLARRVEQEQELLTDRRIVDESLRSSLRDVDFVEASSRFSLLQTQLQATYQVTATANSLSLLDFLR
jgi:flagellin-like hook-associated protein FlgL